MRIAGAHRAVRRRRSKGAPSWPRCRSTPQAALRADAAAPATCSASASWGRSSLMVRVGGPAGALPHNRRASTRATDRDDVPTLHRRHHFSPSAVRSRVRPEEALLASYGVALVAIMATTRPLDLHHRRCTCASSTVFLVLAAARARARLRARAAPTRFAVVGAARRRCRRRSPSCATSRRSSWRSCFYETLHDLTPLIRHDVVDDALIAIDRRAASASTSRSGWAASARRWLTRIMVFCYLSYFFAPAILAALIYWSDRRQLFRDFLVSLCVTTLLGYTGYLLVPAVGPYIFQSQLFPERLPGGGLDSRVVVHLDDRRAQGLRARLLPVAAHGAHDGGAGVRLALLARRVLRLPADRARPLRLDDLPAHALRRRRRGRLRHRGASPSALGPRLERWWYRDAVPAISRA